MTADLTSFINSKKKEHRAVILAHYYQLPEIQDIADYVGDSLQLARQAAETDAEVIVFCGVKFMAESARILSPHKTVLLPVLSAGCPMADMVDAKGLRELKACHPQAAVVCYVNSSAEVKAESDICCTSSNAVAVVNSIPEDKEIIFVPDRNLGRYVQSQTGRNMIFWEGFCPVHDVLTFKEVQELKQNYPQAVVLVHPECPPEVTELADAVRSTAGILKYVKESQAQEFIIGTEEGFMYTLSKACPDKTFYLARTEFVCRDMKYVTLETLADALDKMRYEIDIEEETRIQAYKALHRMLALG